MVIDCSGLRPPKNNKKSCLLISTWYSPRHWLRLKTANSRPAAGDKNKINQMVKIQISSVSLKKIFSKSALKKENRAKIINLSAVIKL
jgi:hypothetical protein